uniref:EGF-like domain-containing protein n=1 Tax=Strigamia maritima TaxID=126957 RepID=T1IYD4_STRMM
SGVNPVFGIFRCNNPVLALKLQQSGELFGVYPWHRILDQSFVKMGPDLARKFDALWFSGIIWQTSCCKSFYTLVTTDYTAVCKADSCELNKGTCRDDGGTAVCDCEVDYFGIRCEVACASSCDPIKNLKCVKDAQAPAAENKVVCECENPNFEPSDAKDISKGCVAIAAVCKADSCELNKGTCRDDGGTAVCDCEVDYFGIRCEVACASSCDPIKNLKCVKDAQAPAAENKVVCECENPNFEPSDAKDISKGCVAIAAVCKADSCELNKGTCRDDGGTAVCDCEVDYFGIRCEVACASSCDPIKNLKCVKDAQAPAAENKVVCECENPNFEPSDAKDISNGCQIINPCKNNPCGSHGRCEIRNDQFFCICNGRFFGTNCELQCTEKMCQNQGTCSIDNGTVKCLCPTGFTGTQCECKENICTKDICGSNADCELINCNLFRCNCKNSDHYWNGTTCQKIDLCSLGVISCKEFEKCEVDDCICEEGHEKIGDKCDPVSNICKTKSNNCPSGSKCVSTESSYICQCNEGYYQANDKNQENVECKKISCEDNCPYRRCNPNGKCLCPDGSEMDAQQECNHAIGCSEKRIEECANENKTCIGQTGSCICKKRFELVNGKCQDINECTKEYFQQYCKPYGKCNNTVGSFECNCGNNKYDDHTNKCLPVNECTLNTHKCNVDSTDCDDETQGYKCKCKPGFKSILGNNTHCEFDNKCLLNPCGSQARKKLYPAQLKLLDEFNPNLTDTTSKDFYDMKLKFEKLITSTLNNDKTKPPVTVRVSSFRDGSTNVFYDILTDFEMTSEEIRELISSQCFKVGKKNEICVIRGELKIGSDYIEDKNTLLILDGCSETISRAGECPKEADCISNPTDVPVPYLCRCRQGYKNIDECLSERTHICSKAEHKICTNLPGSYNCSCEEGFVNIESKCKKLCEEYNPCQNGGECFVNENNSWDCQCKVGYTGNHCQYKQHNLPATLGWKAAVGVLSALLVASIIISVFVFNRRTKKINDLQNAIEYDQEMQHVPEKIDSWFSYLQSKNNPGQSREIKLKRTQ